MSYTTVSGKRSHRFPLMGDCGCGCGGSGGCGGVGEEVTEEQAKARTTSGVVIMGATALGLYLLFGGKDKRSR